jgi:hypothetical protein
MTWIHSLPSPRDPLQYMEPEHAVGYIKIIHLVLAHHEKVENISVNILLHFFRLTAYMNNDDHAYNLIGIYSEKTGYKYKGHKVYFDNSREPTTVALYLNVAFYIKL